MTSVVTWTAQKLHRRPTKSIISIMPSTSIPTSRYPTPPVSSLADPFDFTKKESPSHFCNGDSVVSPPPSALHRIFTEEVDIWHEIMLYAWINGTLRLRQVSDRCATPLGMMGMGLTIIGCWWRRRAVSLRRYPSIEFSGASSYVNSALYMECLQRRMTWTVLRVRKLNMQ